MKSLKLNIILVIVVSAVLMVLGLFMVTNSLRQAEKPQYITMKTTPTKQLTTAIHTEHDSAGSSDRAVRLIIVDGTKRKLYLLRDGTIEEVFLISIGANDLGKRTEGDKKTPLGEYEISWMVSRHGNKGNKIKDGQTWCKNNTLYYGPSGPSGEKLWTLAYGGPEATVMGLNYPNAEDRKKGYTGGCIEIHASRHRKPEPLQPSAGCIKMYPDDALKLYNRVDIGTKVYIVKNYQINLFVIKGILFSIPFPEMDIKEFLERSIGYCPKDVIRDGLPNFGSRRDDWKGKPRKHKGYDIYINNVDVLSAAEGTVIAARHTKLSGPYVKVSHGKGLYTVYIHLTSAKVRKGQRVKRGQVIGRIDGPAGNAVEPQLHFELEIGLNNEVDPLIYIKKYYSKDSQLLNFIIQLEKKLARCKEKRKKLLKIK